MLASRRESVMSIKDDSGSKSKPNRRNILLAGTRLAAAAALGSVASVETAHAQAPPYNIVFIIVDQMTYRLLAAGLRAAGFRCDCAPRRHISEPLHLLGHVHGVSCVVSDRAANPRSPASSIKCNTRLCTVSAQTCPTWDQY